VMTTPLNVPGKKRSEKKSGSLAKGGISLDPWCVEGLTYLSQKERRGLGGVFPEYSSGIKPVYIDPQENHVKLRIPVYEKEGEGEIVRGENGVGNSERYDDYQWQYIC